MTSCGQTSILKRGKEKAAVTSDTPKVDVFWKIPKKTSRKKRKQTNKSCLQTGNGYFSECFNCKKRFKLNYWLEAHLHSCKGKKSQPRYKMMPNDASTILKIIDNQYGLNMNANDHNVKRQNILRAYEAVRSQEWMSFSSVRDLPVLLYVKNNLVPQWPDFVKKHDYYNGQRKGNSQKPNEGNPSSELARPKEVLQGPDADPRTTVCSNQNTTDKSQAFLHSTKISLNTRIDSSSANPTSGENVTHKSSIEVSSMKDSTHSSNTPISINASQPVSIIPKISTNAPLIKLPNAVTVSEVNVTNKSIVENPPPIELTPVTHTSSKTSISKKARHVKRSHSMDSHPAKEQKLLSNISNGLAQVSKVTPAQNAELSKLLFKEVYNQNNYTSHALQTQHIQKPDQVQVNPQRGSSVNININHSMHNVDINKTKPVTSPQTPIVTIKELNKLLVEYGSQNGLNSSSTIPTVGVDFISATSMSQNDSTLQNPLSSTPIYTYESVPAVQIVDISKILKNTSTPFENSIPNQTGIPLMDLTAASNMSEASTTPVTKTSVQPNYQIIIPSDIASIPLPEVSNRPSNLSLPLLITDGSKETSNLLLKASVKPHYLGPTNKKKNPRIFEENGVSLNGKTNKEILLKEHGKNTIHHSKNSSKIDCKERSRNIHIGQTTDNAGKELSHKKSSFLNFKADKENKSLPLIVSDNYIQENKSETKSNECYKTASDINGMVGKKLKDDILKFNRQHEASGHKEMSIKKVKKINGSNGKKSTKLTSDSYAETNKILNNIKKNVMKKKSRFKYYQKKYGIKKCYVSIKSLSSEEVNFHLDQYNRYNYSRYVRDEVVNGKVNLLQESNNTKYSDMISHKISNEMTYDIYTEMDSLEKVFKKKGKKDSSLKHNLSQTSDKHKQNEMSIQSEAKSLHKSLNKNCDTRFKDAQIFNKYRQKKMNNSYKVSQNKKYNNHELTKPSTLPSEAWRKKYFINSKTKKSDNLILSNSSVDKVDTNSNGLSTKSLHNYKYGSIVPLGHKSKGESTLDSNTINMSNIGEGPCVKQSLSNVNKADTKMAQENGTMKKSNDILKPCSEKAEPKCRRDSCEFTPALKSILSNPDNKNNRNDSYKFMQKDRISEKSSEDRSKFVEFPLGSPKILPLPFMNRQPVEEREISVHITEFETDCDNRSISIINYMTDKENDNSKRNLIFDESFIDDKGCDNKLVIADVEDQICEIKVGNKIKMSTITEVDDLTNVGSKSDPSSDTLDVRKKRSSSPSNFFSKNKQPRWELNLERMEINLKPVNFVKFSCQICSETFDCNKDWVQHSSTICSGTPL